MFDSALDLALDLALDSGLGVGWAQCQPEGSDSDRIVAQPVVLPSPAMSGGSLG